MSILYILIIFHCFKTIKRNLNDNITIVSSINILIRETIFLGPSNPTLDIQPSAKEVHAGEDFSLYCRSNEPGVVTEWHKVNGYLGHHIENSGDTLTFRPLREEDSGTYRCGASGYNGHYEKTYDLNVIRK